MRTALILAALLALALAAPSLAAGCAPSTSRADLTSPACLVDGARCHYVADDDSLFAELSIWVYEESNGIPGLQRQDDVVDDTCRGQIRGDTIIL